VNISPRRGGGETGFPPAPAPQGNGETGFPHPSADAGRRPAHPGPAPWEGLGGRSPPKNNRRFIAAWCGAAAWTAEVTIARRVPPPSQPPPAGGRSRVPAPSGGGSGRGPAPCPRRRGAGGTLALPVMCIAAWCAMHMTVSRDHGGTRFPHTPARGRGWAGYALKQGDGETRFPPVPPPGGKVWAGYALPRSMFIPSVCDASRMDG